MTKKPLVQFRPPESYSVGQVRIFSLPVSDVEERMSVMNFKGLLALEWLEASIGAQQYREKGNTQASLINKPNHQANLKISLILFH